MIGSFFLSIVSINFFYYFSFFENFTSFTNKTMLIVFLISVISQIGDMTISFFKRLSKVKDTGKIIPGHGGLLDRIDGMLFTFPVLYLILSLNLLK